MRAFWISRLFRLYPVYLLVTVFVLVMAFWIPVRTQVPRDLSAVSAHATMLLDVVHVGGLADTMWTLSYEMVFYLVVTALFIGGLHRRERDLAIGFGGRGRRRGAGAAAPLLGPLAGLRVGRDVRGGLVCLVSGRFRVPPRTCSAATALVLLLSRASCRGWARRSSR